MEKIGNYSEHVERCKRLGIDPYIYEVFAYDNGELIGSHYSTCTKRYDAKKNMIKHLKDHGIRVYNLKISVKLLK